MARNRVIYQSEALFVNKQYSGSNTVDIVAGGTVGDAITAQDIGTDGFHQIHRVQSANYSFAINRTDVNQFGNLARIDTAVIEAPSVSLDFSYLLTDGTNEDKLGITVDKDNSGVSPSTYTPSAGLEVAASAISGLLSNISGRNYHILTTKEGTDAADNTSAAAGEGSTIISIGNGFVTNYSMEASVGAIPTASVSVEGMNIRSDNASALVPLPSVDPDAGTVGAGTFTLPDAVKGSVGDILKPGDVQLILGNPALIANLTDGVQTSAHIQSVNIGLPMGRSALQRLGSSFGFSREVDFPVQVSVGVSAIMADVRDAQSLFTELYANNKHDLVFVLRKPDTAGAKAGRSQVAFMVKNAVLESESFSSSIGDNKSVDLSFTATVGGPEDITNGLFISGQAGSELPHAVRSE
tara:strand:+ start:8498 stop:9727 length:1230 start_codon:yes stop_codon:yes gene_type:complete